MKNQKLTLNRFKISALDQPKSIRGGGGTTGQDTVIVNGRMCVNGSEKWVNVPNH